MHKSFSVWIISPKWGLVAFFFCDIGLREITMICNENHHTKNKQNIPKVRFITAKYQRTSHCFSSFYQRFYSTVQEKITITCKLTNDSQSNRTIAFITEQKSLATARPFQEPNFKQPLFSLFWIQNLQNIYLSFSSSNTQDSLAFLPHRYFKFCEKVVASDFYGQTRFRCKLRKRHQVFFLLLGKYINDRILRSCAYNFNLFCS